MNAAQAVMGTKYRVLACPAHEYLTIGQIYVCTHQGKFSTGLHREQGGAGTYLGNQHARRMVALEEVAA
jgi:hypothetical protein